MAEQDPSNFNQRIGADNLAPLWERSAPSEPDSPAVAAHWRYEDVRPHLIESGELISKEEAHRRVLVLENPGLRGEYRITRSLYAGLQLIHPGEIAPNHRHTQSALRFVIEGDGAYTAVDGEKIPMSPGDFVVTPSWAWHDHGHEGDGPMVWLDVLDSPLVAFLDAEFREHAGERRQDIARPAGTSSARFGHTMMPMGGAPVGATSPVWSYPYTRARAALEALRAADDGDPCHGIKMEYINPATGRSAMPTIGTFLQFLRGSVETVPYRSTDSTVYCVVEGSGRTHVGDQTFDWRPHDIFVVPSWRWHRHAPAEDAVLFSASDRPVQTSLGLWREERLDNRA